MTSKIRDSLLSQTITVTDLCDRQEAGSIPAEKINILSAMDRAHLKLDALTEANDDETPRPGLDKKPQIYYLESSILL